MVPCTHNEIGERTIHHMEECGWIGNTQRGQNCICLIYDGIHYNALKLNDEQIQPKNDTFNVRSDKKEKREKNVTHLRQSTQHTQKLHKPIPQIIRQGRTSTTNGK